MRKLVVIVLLTISSYWAEAQSFEVIKFDELQKVMQRSSEELTVVNFWATWCGPCIKELPYFEEASKRNDLNVILVSLDFPEEVEKVKAFVKKKGITAPVYLLDEKDYDSYMGKISESWSGALPATLMVKKDGKRVFHEKAFTRETLNTEIDKHID